MTYRVRISQQAFDDIRRSTVWWATNRSTEQAVRWKNAIFDRIEQLDGFPESNAVAYENEKFPFELREALFGLGTRPTHRILFRIVRDEVQVLTVRAAAQDILNPADVQPFRSA